MTRFGNCGCYDGLGVYPLPGSLLDYSAPVVSRNSDQTTGAQTTVQDFDFRTVENRLEVTGARVELSNEIFIYPAWFDLRGRVNLTFSFAPEDAQIIRTLDIKIVDAVTGETTDVLSVSSIARGEIYDESYGGYPLKLMAGTWQVDRFRVFYPFPPLGAPTGDPPGNQSALITFIPMARHRLQITTSVSNGWHQVTVLPLGSAVYNDPALYAVRKLNLC